MPHLERHPWRSDDAATILTNARIVGRCEGSHPDGGRFHGFIIEPEPPHHDKSCQLGHILQGRCFCAAQYAAYWHRGTFCVEPIARIGDPFICDTCEQKGIVGLDGPLYGLDRDPRQPSVSRCRACTTQIG